MIRIHKENQVLIHGSLKFIHGEHNILAYGRFDELQHVVVAFNNGAEEKQVTLPVWEIGVFGGHKMKRLMLTTGQGYTTEPEEYKVENNMEITLTLPPVSAIVLLSMGIPDAVWEKEISVTSGILM